MNPGERQQLHADIDAFLREMSVSRTLWEPGSDAVSFWRHRPVIKADEINVIGMLIERPADAETVARLLGRDEVATECLLEALVAVGVLERRGDRYHATSATVRYLEAIHAHRWTHD